MTKGIELVAIERIRQIKEEGFDADHDSLHDKGELISAARCYLLGDFVGWPWERKWWKPRTKIRNLTKAAALIIAEIDRILEMEQQAYESVDYSNYPTSLLDKKSEESRNAKDWTPRDVLIKALREMDSGEMENVDTLLVVFRDKPKEDGGAYGPGFWACSDNLYNSIALLEVIKNHLMKKLS